MTTLRLATVNVNGVRAAFRKGMGAWLDERNVDILALQEVRAATSDLEDLLGPEWNILHDAATAKGRAGVAIASRGAAEIHRVAIGADEFDTAGRWLEADYRVGDATLTVVSCYVHSGEVDTPKQEEKWKFLDAMESRMAELARDNIFATVVGDLNVGHRELDIKNWKGNVKRAGFLPRERAYFDRILGSSGETVECVDGTSGTGLGWVDVGRAAAGEVPGPYTWCKSVYTGIYRYIPTCTMLGYKSVCTFPQKYIPVYTGMYF
jgi:exodeoxyribonuclease-3